MKTFPRVLLATLSILLAVLLAASLLASAGIFTVRRALSPAFVENTVDGLDFAAVRFPDGWGGFTTLLDEFNDALGWYGIAFTRESLNEMVRSLSFDRILKDYLLDLRTWLLEYGPAPVLDPDEAARTVLSGVDHGRGVYEPADLVVLGCFVREGWVLLALELAGIVVVAIWAFRVALRMLVVCVDGLVDAVHDLRDLARGLRRGGRVIFKPRLKACAALYAEDLALLQGGAALGAILE